MRIFLTGGGTMGSVTPLLAVAQQLQQHGHTLFFVGTHTGPEKKALQNLDIPFTGIISAKFRRYISVYHFLVPFQLVIGCCQALWLLWRKKPDVIVSAGGFVAVPLVWAARLCRIPSIIHQQDLHPGLANKLMLPFVSLVTVAFEESLKNFPQAQWIGNPVRDLTPTTHAFSLDPDVPTVLVIGGGTGAQAINEMVSSRLCEHANVIHVTGHGREGAMEHITHARYHKRAFLGEELKEALNASDVVVSRAGLGAITELATLGKPAIIIPMPHSHQEHNAQMLKQHDAAVVCEQDQLTRELLTQKIVNLLQDKNTQKRLSQHIRTLFPPESTKRFADLIEVERS